MQGFPDARQLASRYAASSLFSHPTGFVSPGNPFRRPVRPQDLVHCELTSPLPRERFASASALTAQRLLLNVYEGDLLFLWDQAAPSLEHDFRAFYADETRVLGEQLRPFLERHLFGFLASEIDVSGPWNTAAMMALFEKRLAEANSGDNALCAAILGAREPGTAARQFLVQLASDFLTEASAMARNVLGNYGPALSELFKVLIDEYGYGLHQVKHSTLFEETLRSVQLCADVHAYWQLNLASSLALVNYFHFVSRNHAHFFRYCGALYYTEATLAHANRSQSAMLRAIFGDTVDTRYFDEHVHIDRHHGRMVAENLIPAVLERCGEGVIPEIIRGFEEFRLLQRLADEDLMAQLAWSCDLEGARARAAALVADEALLARCEPKRFTEPQGELTVTHVHDEDELFLVEEGALELVAGVGCTVRLGAGEGLVIPRGRLHGTLVLSERCVYAVRGLGEGTGC